ncbi:retrovirus-related pol polyprotein from transposon TNT 1-94 [Tanacetum coccineum]
MATLADEAILSGADNRSPTLEKDMYDSWKSRMELYMLNRQHTRMILESVKNGPLIWPSIEENRLHAYLGQHEFHANEVGLMPERNLDPLALVTPSDEPSPPTNSSKLLPKHSISTTSFTISVSIGRQRSLAASTTRAYTPGSGSNSGKQRTVICYNCKGEGHMSKQCTKPNEERDESCPGIPKGSRHTDCHSSQCRLSRLMILMQLKLIVIKLNTAKHIDRKDRSQLTNLSINYWVQSYLVNDHVAKILGYGDYQIGNVTTQGFTMWKDMDTTYNLLL